MRKFFILFLIAFPLAAHAKVFPLPVSTPTAASLPRRIFRPAPTPYPNPLNKHIIVDISDQRLSYFEGENLIGSVLVSSAARGFWTPRGEFAVQMKRPTVLYRGYKADGTISYYYPNTKWNLQFLPHLYIHGAYWHNEFGHPRSHGCVNVSYANMAGLYDWADVGTPVTIQD